METLLLSLVIIALAAVGLSLGVIMGRQPIRGSCGGLSCIEGAQCTACARHEAEGRVE